ncbi:MULTISPECIES: hypothetical protein [unclassified Variovorax]|uniref:hypothetical protein n=1 Tax=unclassified Variovorax TaxID=663243 RepID=UPI00076CF032|nr:MULTISPECIES: hypothetical protein [unclassified Variovorax]KWT98899.1 putative terminase large subunit protein [Variovorax sp. WDL1]PNG56035.1 hypothetical protein CHC07_02449 [Variovorax sp. B4]PNG57459.1 hypothetical protein CHC06_02452 [Variovorax sp. B2]VTV10163.1 large terminase protein [Variovorax sp. WDL1]
MTITIVHDTPLQPLPTNELELAKCLADPEWRLFSGCLYKIMIKGDDGEEAFVMPFKPNAAQRRFIRRLWHRNLILKARQLGFTTLIAILWLDHALFNADQRCGIIAQDREAAEAIFRDKVKFGYQNLPDEIRERFPLARDSAVELCLRTTTPACAWPRRCAPAPSTGCTSPSSARSARSSPTRRSR